MCTERVESAHGWLAFSIVMAFMAMVVCLWRDAPLIQADIQQRAEKALMERGIGATSLVFTDGRDVTLRGRVDARVNRQDLLRQVRSLLGVRAVVDELTTLVRQPPHLKLDVLGDSANLEGALSDKNTMERIIQAVARVRGIKEIDNRVSITDAVDEPYWLDGLVAFIPWYAVDAPASLSIRNKVLLLEGTVASAKQREAIGAKANAAFFGSVSVKNAIQVLPPNAAPYLAFNMPNGSEGIITLFGSLDNDASVQRVIKQIERHFPAGVVRYHLSIERVKTPEWIDELDAFLAVVRTAGDVAFSIDASGVLLLGTVESTEERASIVKHARPIAAALPVVNRILVRPAGSLHKDRGPSHEKSNDTVSAHASLDRIFIDTPVRPAVRLGEFQAGRPVVTSVEPGSLEFAPDSAELDTSSKETLDHILGVLNDHAGIQIEITGHSDARGDQKYNVELSRKRVESVTEYLVGRGLEPHRLTTSWFGQTRPVADNETTDGRARNRRVEIRMVGKSGE